MEWVKVRDGGADAAASAPTRQTARPAFADPGCRIPADERKQRRDGRGADAVLD